VDDVIIAAGTEQEEGIFVVQSGKCDVVHGLALKDHALELQEDLDNMHHELLVGLLCVALIVHFFFLPLLSYCNCFVLLKFLNSFIFFSFSILFGGFSFSPFLLFSFSAFTRSRAFLAD
jgi:hypothetical protein